MTEQFINELKASPYYQRIFGDREVVMISFTGSRLIDITDDRSDGDLMVLTNDQKREEHVAEFLTYGSKKVHWHYVPITKLISNEGGTLLSCVGEVQFIGLSDNKIIYANPKYATTINFLKKHKKSVALVGSYGLVRFKNDLISGILNADEIKPENYTKFIYHLCFASYVLLQEMPNKNFLSSIKRIRWSPVSEEYRQLAIKRLRILQDFVTNNPVNLSEIIRSFNKGIMMTLK